MGLSDAIQETLGVEDKVLSCPKCLVFWLSLAHLILCGCRLLTAVGASFIFSYVALWLDLGLSALNKKHNEISDKIFSAENGCAAKARKRAAGSKTGENSTGVPSLRKKR